MFLLYVLLLQLLLYYFTSSPERSIEFRVILLLLRPTPLLIAQCYLDGCGDGCSISSGDPLRVLRTRSVCIIMGHTRHAQAQERQRHMNFYQHFITPNHKYNRLLAHNRGRHTYTGTAGRVALTRSCSSAQATGLGPSRQPTTLSLVLRRHETRHSFPAPQPSLSCSVGQGVVVRLSEVQCVKAITPSGRWWSTAISCCPRHL